MAALEADRQAMEKQFTIVQVNFHNVDEKNGDDLHFSLPASKRT